MRSSAAVFRGVLVIGVLLILGLVAINTPNGVPGRSYRTMYTVLPDIGNLQTHNDVRIGGVRVGQVLKTTAASGKARLKLQLNGNVGDLPIDTTAVVRSAGLLGQRYLELIPGGAQNALPENATIRASTNSITLGVPETLQTFDAETRGALGDAVGGLGTGLTGRSRDLNAAIGVSPSAATDFRTLAGAVTADPQAARALLPSLSSAASALDRSKDALVADLAPTTAALEPFVSQRSAVRQLLDQAPTTLATLRPALSEGGSLLRSARAVATAVQTTLPDAPAALRSTTALLNEARQPLRQTRPLLQKARTAVPATLKIADSASPVLTPLREVLNDLVPPVTTLGDHGCDIVNFGKNWRSFLSFGSPGGGKIGPLGEIRAEAIVTQPFAEGGTALKLPGTLVDRDTYPAPCKYKSTPYSLTDPTK